MADPLASPRPHLEERKSFAPKQPVDLAPPKSDSISYEQLKEHDGTSPDKPAWVAIKGTVFDVSRNNAYGPGGNYAVFAGKDPSRALATSSLKAEDCVPEWADLEDKHKTVLDEWYTFFSKRYNIVGKISLANDTTAAEESKM